MRKLARIILYILGAVVALAVVFVAALFIIYPAEYVYRSAVWGDADVYDYQKFPAAEIQNAPPVFEFEQAPQEAQVAALFEQVLGVDDFEAFLEANSTQAFLVIQDDALLYEGYFNGAQRDSIVTSFSVAKSFDSTLVGIAIAEGYIHSVDDPITDYLPELLGRDPAFASITIQDLLHMSSGIKYVETSFFNGDDAKTYYYPDLRQLALQQTRILEAPGQHMLYNNYHPLLIGMILERSTGMSVSEYLQEKIWKQIGAEYPASWSLDSEQTRFEKMESGLNARAIDFAKFGRLFLHGGEWNGQQVVPADWVQQATQPNMPENYADYYPEYLSSSGNGYYQYFWWGYVVDEDNYDFLAQGNKGQYIYISPQKDLIIVRHGERYGENAALWVHAFYDFARALPAAQP